MRCVGARQTPQRPQKQSIPSLTLSLNYDIELGDVSRPGLGRRGGGGGGREEEEEEEDE